MINWTAAALPVVKVPAYTSCLCFPSRPAYLQHCTVQATAIARSLQLTRTHDRLGCNWQRLEDAEACYWVQSLNNEVMTFRIHRTAVKSVSRSASLTIVSQTLLCCCMRTQSQSTPCVTVHEYKFCKLTLTFYQELGLDIGSGFQQD